MNETPQTTDITFMDVTYMDAEQFDEMLTNIDVPQPAPQLAKVMARPRRFRRDSFHLAYQCQKRTEYGTLLTWVIK